MKIVLISFILAVSPLAAGAMCSDEHTSASACASGQHWDAEKLQCVPTVNS